MSDLIPQNSTYLRPVLMTDPDDNKTGVPGLTLTVQLSKNGSVFSVVSRTITQGSLGIYYIALTAADTDTVGSLDMVVTATGANVSATHDQVFTPSLSVGGAGSTLGGTFFNLLLQLLLQNVTLPNFGDATGLRGTIVAGSLYVGLATGDPGIGGSQLTNETTYGGYARQAIARSASGFSVSGLVGSNLNVITYPIAASGSDTIQYAVVGTELTGAGLVVARCPLVNPFGVTAGVTPRFAVGDLSITVA